MLQNCRVLVIITIGLGFIISAGFYSEHQYTRYERAYARLKPGTTKAEVLRRFGKPREITKCSGTPSWDDQPLDEKFVNCIEEFRYSSRMRVGEWIVGFDKHDVAVAKSYSSSP